MWGGKLQSAQSERLPQGGRAMMMVLWQVLLLCWTRFNWAFGWRCSWRWCGRCWLCLSCFDLFTGHFAYFDVRIDCAHAEVEIRAVLLIVLWTCVRTNLRCGLEKSAGSTALFFFRRKTNEVEESEKKTQKWVCDKSYKSEKKRAHYNVTNVMQSNENRNEVRIVFSSYFHLLSIFHPNFRRKFSSFGKKFFSHRFSSNTHWWTEDARRRFVGFVETNVVFSWRHDINLI